MTGSNFLPTQHLLLQPHVTTSTKELILYFQLLGSSSTFVHLLTSFPSHKQHQQQQSTLYNNTKQMLLDTV